MIKAFILYEKTKLKSDSCDFKYTKGFCFGFFSIQTGITWEKKEETVVLIMMLN